MRKFYLLIITLFALLPFYSLAQNIKYLNSFEFITSDTLKILNEALFLLEERTKNRTNFSIKLKSTTTSTSQAQNSSSTKQISPFGIYSVEFEEEVRNFLNKTTSSKNKRPKINCLYYEFKKPLKFGDYDEEVYYVQKFLNQNPQTQVAETGPGSPGKETKYFGRKTFEAVKKIQEMAKKFILEPIGLEKPTGFWGPSTISFANKLTSVCKK